MTQTFTCDKCGKKTKDPIWTPEGVVCEECVENDPSLNDSQVPTLNEVITQ